jgi:hypothetical protein
MILRIAHLLEFTRSCGFTRKVIQRPYSLSRRMYAVALPFWITRLGASPDPYLVLAIAKAARLLTAIRKPPLGRVTMSGSSSTSR